MTVRFIPGTSMQDHISILQVHAGVQDHRIRAPDEDILRTCEALRLSDGRLLASSEAFQPDSCV